MYFAMVLLQIMTSRCTDL